LYIAYKSERYISNMSLKVSDSQPIQLAIAHFFYFSEKHEVLKGVACLSPMKERNDWDNHKGKGCLLA